MKIDIQDTWGFILESNHSYSTPIWLIEFDINVNQFRHDNEFIICVKSFFQMPLTQIMSWPYWVLADSYYIRSDTVELHESFGLLTDNWKKIKSKSLIDIPSTM